MNATGEWLAFGSGKLGQLLVWEWQSESYILKQQGHYDSTNCIAHSPDGQKIITAADDGKIKVWDANSGFCIVTFTEHMSGVTACQFAKRGNVLFTASLDGSIRAWDLVRYRNFRTFTAPKRLQFTSLAVDPTGEIVCAGSLDSFDVHVWSVQTGQLLETLPGHEGPVSALAFTADGATLASGSWDKTVRVWDIFSRTQASEPFEQSSDVLSIAFRPDGKELSVATMDGQLSFWSLEEGLQKQLIDGKKDISGGRKATDRRTAANSTTVKHFKNITYSADGTCVLGGGNSKYICLYDVASGSLLKRFTVSRNLSLDGTQEILNSKNMTEAGALELIDQQGEAEDLEDRIDRTLPGAARGDLSVRKTRPEIRVTGISFSPTGRSFAASSTEGLLVYSLDNVVAFDPFDLDLDITPKNILSTLNKGDYAQALVMAFRLNEGALLHRVFEHIPPQDISLVAAAVPSVYLDRLLRLISNMGEQTPHLEFVLLWAQSVLARFGDVLNGNSKYEIELRTLLKMLKRVQKELAKLADESKYTLEYILNRPKQKEGRRGIRVPSPLELEDGFGSDEEMLDDELLDDDEGDFAVVVR